MQVSFFSKVKRRKIIFYAYILYIYIHTGGNGGAERFDDDCDD